MSLPKEVVEDVLHLNIHSKHFQRLMAYWKKRSEDVVLDILSPMTPVDERDILVRFYDTFKREVVDLPLHAYNQDVKANKSTER